MASLKRSVESHAAVVGQSLGTFIPCLQPSSRTFVEHGAIFLHDCIWIEVCLFSLKGWWIGGCSCPMASVWTVQDFIWGLSEMVYHRTYNSNGEYIINDSLQYIYIGIGVCEPNHGELLFISFGECKMISNHCLWFQIGWPEDLVHDLYSLVWLKQPTCVDMESK